MKIYKELEIKGNVQELEKFEEYIKNVNFNGWVADSESMNKSLMDGFLIIKYNGEKISKVHVFLHKNENGNYYVPNIVPYEEKKLSMSEYNDILDEFYKDIIANYKDIIIDPPTSDEYNIKNDLSDESIQKLKRFSNAANKSTGTSHPYDKERWLDFVCNTFYERKIIDSWLLKRYLNEELNWSEDMSSELASEYNQNIVVLNYYYDKYVR